MSYFRSYFEKNNTIIKNYAVNTAKNPTTEIFYGSGFSKYLFKVDFSDLISKIQNGDLVINTNTRHYLKMTNTIFGDPKLIGEKRNTGKQRTTSFDLILFKISENWDEGIGFDYEDGGYDFTYGNNTFDERPSNWFNRTTLNEWTIPGVYSTSPTILTTIHFDNGNENVYTDITDYVNGIIVSGNTNHGLGLAFAVLYQDINDEYDQSVSFFTKYTQTFYEPFVESVFDDLLQDNRQNFITERENNLYLYVTKGSNFYDLDELPVVDILNSSETPITGLTGLTTTKIKKGIYKVTFGITGELCDGKRFFYDKWKNLNIDDISISNVIQKFVPKPFSSYYSFGSNPTESQNYIIQFHGIKQNEKIIRGELKKIVIDFKSIEVSKSQLFENVYYRIFIKEGKTNVIVYDWTKFDMSTNENSFYLDTSFMIPREYILEFKALTHTEEIFYPNYIKFEIMSEK
jgi:hypothetical protein